MLKIRNEAGVLVFLAHEGDRAVEHRHLMSEVDRWVEGDIRAVVQSIVLVLEARLEYYDPDKESQRQKAWKDKNRWAMDLNKEVLF